ncbi:unnamed protein product [Rotaria sp. Silwood2]|nr:unnamed protein product [Rotaria sp. Silwood2]CAF2977183.1 unnamed protein product [Rotaria sp. Silwood2]CAF3137778.1 unnamed protein product [Rotaria sp. Silwood2]CAF4064277.1 unnamed protein product [Rotaria sp. Silwood2]CAF4149596.1 unnamed protein product [Rotaria sp. Silwood2]
MLEAIGIAVICIGAIAVAISGLAAMAIAFAPVVSSPEDKYEINEEEYQDRLRANYESVYMYTEFGGFPRTRIPRSSVYT